MIDRGTHRALVGLFSTLAAQGAVGKLRRATPFRPPSVVKPTRPVMRDWLGEAKAADRVVSGVGDLPPGI